MAKRIIHKNTPEQSAAYRQKLAKVEAHKEEFLALGRKWKREQEKLLAELSDVFRELRAERERQGLSLADISERSGIPRESICRLENMEQGNFQITTIQRYADALGLKVKVALVPAA